VELLRRVYIFMRNYTERVVQPTRTLPIFANPSFLSFPFLVCYQTLRNMFYLPKPSLSPTSRPKERPIRRSSPAAPPQFACCSK